MTKDHDDPPNDRGALVLAPEPARRGTFALLVPGNLCWEVSDFAGGFRLDFRPMTPAEHMARSIRPTAPVVTALLAAPTRAARRIDVQGS